MHRSHQREPELIVVFDNDREEIKLLKQMVNSLRRIERELLPPTPSPAGVTFQEISMLPATAGNTLVYTGTFTPQGAAAPGASFSVSSSDPSVVPTVDSTGLVVTIPLGDTFVDDPANPLTVTWNANGITPVPAGSPSSLRADIVPSLPVQPVPSPTGVVFAQTT